MTNGIEPGFDCCNDYREPHRTPRIYPRKPTMDTGTNINLYLKLVHPQCYESCFTWRITSGGGYLDPEFGIETYYHAPAENAFCGQNPTIEARCPRERLDRIQIGVNQHTQSAWAFITAGGWKDGASAVGTTCGGYLAVYPWQPFASPQFSCIQVFRRNCDGSIRNVDALQIMAMMRRPYEGGWEQDPDRFYSPTGILTAKASGKIVKGSFAECKQGVLNARMHMWLGAWIEAQYPRPSWDNAVEACRAGGLLQAYGVLDVRAPKLLKQGCCHHSLVRELDELPGRVF